MNRSHSQRLAEYLLPSAKPLSLFRMACFSLIFLFLLNSFSFAQSNPFQTTWSIPGDDLELNLPLSGTNFSIDWGDGTVETGLSSALLSTIENFSHTYSSAGNYTVIISLGLTRIQLGASDDAADLITIDQWGDIQWTSMNEAFRGAANMTMTASDVPDLSGVTVLTGMFEEAATFNQPVDSWDISNISSLQEMFKDATSFNQPLDNWDVSNVTSTISMFRNATAFDQNLNSWNTSGFIDISGMFSRATSFNGAISNWDVSNVTNMNSLFLFASSFNQPIGDWSTGNVTRMSGIFNGAASFNQPIGNWDVSQVQTFQSAFTSATVFNQDISAWDVGSATSMTSMFRRASVFNQPIGNWDVSDVRLMQFMFENASEFNQPLNDWDVSQVTNMRGMFNVARKFNQDLDNWNVGNVTDMFRMFATASKFAGDISTWDVGQVITMQNMLSATNDFNSDIGGWEVKSVQNMDNMLRNALSFDHSLGDWDVSSVTTMRNMLSISGMSVESYDNTLIGWSALPSLQSNVPLGAQLVVYCLGEGARQSLIDSFNWDITLDVKNCDLVFSSPTSSNFPENSTNAVIDVNASIAGNPSDAGITYSLGASGDNVFCSIDPASGVIEFLNPPDFENPLDGNSNNGYVLEVIAISGSNSETQQLTVTVTDIIENFDPAFTSAPIISVDLGDIYSYDITTSDADGDEVSLSAPTLPTWLGLTQQAGDEVTTIAGTGTNGFVNGPGNSANFSFPTSIATDAAGNAYVADQFNHSIRKISPEGEVTTLAGNGARGSADGLGTLASFNEPIGIAVGPAGNIYVADFDNNKIRKITPAGEVTTLAGTGAGGALDGPAASATFNFPHGVAVDDQGNVYVADLNNHSIRKISTDGNVTTLAGSGSPGFANGNGTNARFHDPRGVAVDHSGNVYVADHDNHRIRLINPSGDVTTFAGSGSQSFADGSATAAAFNFPVALSFDRLGNLLVADQDNHRIRIIDADGNVQTLAGTGSQGFTDGATTLARFSDPTGVCVDNNGNIWVADRLNQRIRLIGGEGFVLTGDTQGQLPGDYPVVLQADDGNGGTATQNFTVTIKGSGPICGVPITADIEFTADLTCATGFTVDSDNVIIDGKGFTLFLTTGSQAFNLLNRKNVTIKNLKVVYTGDTNNAVFGTNLESCTFENNDFSGALNGIICDGTCANNTITGNNLSGAQSRGVIFRGGSSSGDVITNNVITDCQFDAIQYSGTPGEISGNDFTGCGSAVSLSNSTNYSFAAPGSGGGNENTYGGHSRVFNFTDCSDITIEDWDFTSLLTDGPRQIALFFDGATNCTIRNNNLSGQLFGVEFNGVTRNNLITGNDCSNANNRGLFFRDGDHIGNVITNNNLSDCFFDGLLYQGGTPGAISGNDFSGSTRGLYLEDVVNYEPGANTYNDNVVSIFCLSCDGVTFTNTVTNGNGGLGIGLTDCSNVTIDNNASCGQDTGIDISGTGSGNRVVNSRIANSSRGIRIESGIENTSIDNIQFFNNGQDILNLSSSTVIGVTDEATVVDWCEGVAPTITVANINVDNEPGQCGATIFDYGAEATSNAGIADFNFSIPEGSFFDPGTTEVIAFASDVNGNVSRSTFTVVVNDVEAPTLIARGITVELDENGQAQLPPLNPEVILFQGTFDDDTPAQNTNSLVNWNVTGGNVDVYFANQFGSPFNDNALELAGSVNGSIESKETFTLEPGNYLFSFEARGFNGDAAIGIDIGNVLNTSFTNFTGSRQTVVFEFTVTQTTTATIRLNEFGGGDAFSGTLLDNLLLQKLADSILISASDNCEIVSITPSVTEFGCNELGTQLVTLTVADEAGNEASETVEVQVVDNIAPTFATRESFILLLDENGQASVTPADYNLGTVLDNCGVDRLEFDRTDFGCGDVGFHVINVTAFDASGNATTTQADVEIRDEIAPVITLIGDASIDIDLGTAYVEQGANVVDNCNAPLVIGGVVDTNSAGSYIVTYNAIDENGNPAQEVIRTVNVIQVDVEGPVITANDITAFTRDDRCSAIVENFGVTATDESGVADITFNLDEGAVFETGTTSVTATATDTFGNISTATFNVTVIDNVAPTFDPNDVTVELDQNGVATLNVPAAPQIIFSDDFEAETPDLSVNNLTNWNVTQGNVDVFEAAAFSLPTTTTSVELAGNANGAIETKNAFTLEPGNYRLRFDYRGATGEAAIGIDIGSVLGASITEFTGEFFEPAEFDFVVTQTTTATIRFNEFGGGQGIFGTLIDNIRLLRQPDTGIVSNVYDNCQVTSITASRTEFTCADVGPQTVTVTVADEAGNESTADITVNVVDNSAPVFLTRESFIIFVDQNGEASVTPADFNEDTVIDNCGVTNIEFDRTQFGCSDVGFHVINITATDGAGNSTVGQADVEVRDEIAPVITLIGDAVIDVDLGTAYVEQGADVVDNCDAPLVIGGFVDTNALGTYIVTYNAVDENGLPAQEVTRTVNVIQVDFEGPVITANDITAFTRDDRCSAVVNDYEVTATDASGVADITYNFNPGTVFSQGTTVVEVTATDVLGNESNATFNVTVIDNVAPFLQVNDVTVELDQNGDAELILPAAPQIIFSDDFESDATGLNLTALNQWNVTQGNVDVFFGGQFGLPTTNNSLELAGNTNGAIETKDAIVFEPGNYRLRIDYRGITGDAAIGIDIGTLLGASITEFTNEFFEPAEFDFVVTQTTSATIRFNEFGSLTAGSGVLIDNVRILRQPDSDGVIFNVFDNCEVTSITASRTDFTCADLGQQPVTITVADAAGNETTGDIIVNVVDNSAPRVLSRESFILLLDQNGQASITPADLNPDNLEDNCGITDIQIDRTEFGCGDVGFHVINITVTDTAGNVGVGQADVEVRDEIAPVFLTRESFIVFLDANGNATLTPDQYNTATIQTNCDLDRVEFSRTDFGCGDVGFLTIDVTAFDGNGLATTTQADVEVRDEIAPVVTFTDGVTGLSTEDPRFGSPNDCVFEGFAFSGGGFYTIVSDNCSSLFTVNEKQFFNGQLVTDFTFTNLDIRDHFPYRQWQLGTTTMVITVTDENGNQTTGSYTQTIVDDVAPVVITQDFTVALDAAGQASITVDDVDNGSMDPCGIASRMIDVSSFTCDNLGANTVTLTVTDLAGNLAQGNAIVTVVDQTAPTVFTQDITIALGANGEANISPQDIDGGTSDNCDFILSVDQTSFNCASLGENMVTLTATDGSGNSASANATVTVIDNTAPVVDGITVDVALDENGNGSLSLADLDGAFTDNCGVATINVNTTSFTCDDLGENPVTVTVTDSNGNTTTGNITVNVIDILPPTVVTEDIALSLDENGQAVITADDVLILSEDEIDTGEECTVSAAEHHAVWLSDYVRKRGNGGDDDDDDDDGWARSRGGSDLSNHKWWRRGRGRGNDDDDDDDRHHRPENTRFVFNADGGSLSRNSDGTATVTGTILNTANANDQWVVSLNLENARNWDEWSAMGRSYKDEAGLAHRRFEDWIYYEMAAGSKLVGAGINAGDEITLSHAPADFRFGFQLGEAANSKNGNFGLSGWFFYTNRKGHVEQGDFNLDVTDCTPNTPPSDVGVTDDNCSLGDITLSQTLFTCSDIGENQVEITVADQSGNETTAFATVTITDDMAPVAVAQDITVSLGANGTVTIAPQDLDGGSTDNCAIVSYSLSQDTFTCDDVSNDHHYYGYYWWWKKQNKQGKRVTLTVTDAAGNTSSADAYVTVVDDTAPVISEEPVIIVVFGNRKERLRYVDVASRVTDNCGIKWINFPWKRYSRRDVGMNTVMISAKDKSGNVTTGPLNVEVIDISSYGRRVEICYNGQTRRVGRGSVQHWLRKGASLGSCDTGLAMTAGGINLDDVLGGEVTKEPLIELGAYPNPTQGETLIKFSSDVAGPATVGVISPNGVRLTTLFEGEVAANENIEVRYNTSQLPSGMYIVRLVTAGEVRNLKLMVKK